MLYPDMLAAIGGTPLVRLRVDAAPGVEVYAKLELANPFAMKDRVARHVITSALADGTLQPGAPIVESSSGTMALGIALVGTYLGHPVHIVTDPRIDPITLAKLRALGCEVHVVSAMTGQGWQSARLELLDELMATLPGAFWPQQYSNPRNPESYAGLAAELVADLGRVDVMVGATGSGGSLCGSTRALRAVQPSVRAVAVDCCGSVLFGQADDPKRRQSGLGNSLMPPNLDHGVLDEVHWLNDREAFEGTDLLAREQKIFAGNTAGSVYTVLKHIAMTSAPGSRIVGILPDRGDRYVDSVHSPEHRLSLVDLPLATVPVAVPYGTQVSSWSWSALPATRSREESGDALTAVH